MPAPAKRRATYADLANLPEHVVGEIVDGELVTSPRPGPMHAVAASGLGAELSGPFHRGRGGPGGWWILLEPEVHLEAGTQIVVPDWAGWRVESLPELPATPWFDTVPDWVCEIASPSTAALDRADKMPLYARVGVTFLWIVDPNAQTLETYGLESRRWVLLGTYRGDRGVRAPPFDAIELDLAALWARPTRGA